MEKRPANFRHLRAFCEVARQQSIRKASARVYLSQPAITQAIAKLEVSLDVSLFDRRSEGMFVTDPGKLYLARVERALGYIETGSKEATRLGQKKGSRGFAISTTWSPAFSYGPPPPWRKLKISAWRPATEALHNHHCTGPLAIWNACPA